MVNGIKYVTKYILLFDSGVPIWLLLVLLIIMTGVVTYLYLIKKNLSLFVRNASGILLLGYVFLVMCSTLLFRNESENVKYALCPFWSYHYLYYKMIAGLILNVLMFVPIGFFIGWSLKEKHIHSAIAFSLVLSLFIETMQLITKRGIFNIDDIIHNVLGGVIGYGIFRLCKSIPTAWAK